jgi:ABC-type branched-subunit amino acid transport system permease subunit
MIFMVLVGGLGTFEGPIIGAILFFAIQYAFANFGTWYLIGWAWLLLGLRCFFRAAYGA